MNITNLNIICFPCKGQEFLENGSIIDQLIKTAIRNNLDVKEDIKFCVMLASNKIHEMYKDVSSGKHIICCLVQHNN